LNAAQLATAALVGLILGVIDAALGVAAQAVSGQLDLPTGETALVAVGILIATTAAAVIGASIGTITASPALAAAGPLLWMYLAEPLIAQVSYPLYVVLPGGMREALLRHSSPHHHIPTQPIGLAIAAAWCLAFATAATLVLSRRDIDQRLLSQ
jgi:hypothetical protein